MPDPAQLPVDLYRAEQVRELDRAAIEDHQIPGLQLMERAGQDAFALARERWADVGSVTVVCGAGNNGGDGYVFARLALEAGLRVRVLQLGDRDRIRGDALVCLQAYLDAGGEFSGFQRLPEGAGLIVDGIFGTGLERKVEGEWRDAVEAINGAKVPVLSLDIPSGLHSDTGGVLGVAVRADASISFIGLKQGMFTGQGPEYCGEVHFSDLQVPAEVYREQQPSALRIDWQRQSGLLPPRPRTAHKGMFGHVLVIGGDTGFSGAARMAAEAAARCGGGLISIATRQVHAALISGSRPELMSHCVESAEALAPLMRRASVLAIGPGLGQGEWGMSMFKAVLQSGLPMVVDADALNLLAAQPESRDNWVLTPHPGEAARLLGCTTAEIMADRFKAVTELQARYGGTVLLKGAGTLIRDGSRGPVQVCVDGNPGMASGGMGDLLTGIIAGLIAQGIAPATAMGACLHGAAADLAAREGERGMLAGDLYPLIRRLMNPEIDPCCP